MKRKINKFKVFIVLIVIIIIIALCIFLLNKKTDKFEDENNNINTVENTLEEDNRNLLENESIENDIVKNEIISNEITSDNSQEKNVVVGKEEKESTDANAEKTRENRALELAKKEWGLNTDVYGFEAEKQEDGTYKVIVRDKTTTYIIDIYIVNVDTGIVKNIQ